MVDLQPKNAIFVVEKLSIHQTVLFMAENMEVENVICVLLAMLMLAHTNQDQKKHLEYWETKKCVI